MQICGSLYTCTDFNWHFCIRRNQNTLFTVQKFLPFFFWDNFILRLYNVSKPAFFSKQKRYGSFLQISRTNCLIHIWISVRCFPAFCIISRIHPSCLPECTPGIFQDLKWCKQFRLRYNVKVFIFSYFPSVSGIQTVLFSFIIQNFSFCKKSREFRPVNSEAALILNRWISQHTNSQHVFSFFQIRHQIYLVCKPDLSVSFAWSDFCQLSIHI